MHHDLSVWPPIIQGGMGVGVSNWRLAKAVSQCGQVGTVSIVEIGHILARRLQLGYDAVDIKRACEAFPVPKVAERIFNRYHKHPEVPIPKTTLSLSREAQWLTILGSFVEVWLAKEGHRGKVAANMLAKVDMIMLPTLLGAVWAGVDAFIIGAGLPLGIPEAMDGLLGGESATYSVEILIEKSPTPGEKSVGRRFARMEQTVSFDIAALLSKEGVHQPLPVLQRPAFIPIVSLEMAAKILERKIGDDIDGYYIEDPVLAGGHNPGPRKGGVSPSGEPLYTEKDQVNLAVFRELGRPFWMAGGQSSPTALHKALEAGAQGIACGSIFALSNESGIREDLRREARRRGYLGELTVRSSLVASPTGYPFQVASLPGTLSDQALYGQRERTCIIGNLQTPVRLLRSDGREILSYRCSAEPILDFEAKGGSLEATTGRVCLCQGLLATVGLGFPGQLPIVTLGKDLAFLRQMLFDAEASYSAREAVQYLLGE